MSTLNGRAAATPETRRWCGLVPLPVACVLVALLLVGLAVSILIVVVVRNALLLVSVLLLASIVVAFLVWNWYSLRKNRALLLFVDRLPASDLLTAKDGQLVKITGFASCADIALESTYEKVGSCVYSSTRLYEFSGLISQSEDTSCPCFRWNLTSLERFTSDFYITDIRSNTRILVKAGNNSKVIPLVHEDILVKTRKNRVLSSTLKKWLEARHLSTEPRLLRLQEGYIREGSCLTVMGILSRKSGVMMVEPPPEPISTGFLWQRFLLPVDVYGLVLKL